MGNLRTITQERKRKLDKWPHFFINFLSSICDIDFCIWKLPKFIFMGSSFRPFWSAKYLNFGGVSCEIRILSRLVQETYTLRKVKTRFYFFFWVEKQICLISWSTFAWSRMLVCIELKLRFLNFKPVFLRMHFSLVATFFCTFGYLLELKFKS